jgi:hypothetical protein
MPERPDFRSLSDAAEQAAVAGDLASAERLLREAALLQEAALGPHHPDLASTLNNLGIVCERLDMPADAELCYRRACAIAAAALEPDDPLAATSRANLRDFCEARGIPVELPVSPTVAAAAAQSPTRAGERSTRPETPAHAGVSRPAARLSPVIILAIVAVGLALTIALVTRGWVTSSGTAGLTPEPASSTASPNPAPVPPSADERAARSRAATSRQAGTGARAPAAGAAKDDPGPRAATPAPAPARAPARPPVEGRAAASVPAPALVVAEARLCERLAISEPGGAGGDWTCEPAGTPVRQGPLFFYTRVRSDRDTTLQHRWYLGDRLRQAVALRIRASSSLGFRTYSRITVPAAPGDWKVELRAADGALLHEAHFAVQ